MISHRLLCGSDDLKSFLTDPDYEFEKKKKETQDIFLNDEFNKGMLETISTN
jgi:hypothetical protein